MKNSPLQFVFALLALIVGGAAEELLPRCFGVGFPVLLVASHYLAGRWPLVASALFALAAGAIEDALSGLPLMTSASYFLLVVLLVRYAQLPRQAAAFTYPGYQLWLWVWTSGVHAEVFGRVPLALIIGALTAAAVVPLMDLIRCKGALDEVG